MYPPANHMLRDLALVLERGGGLVDRVVIPTPAEVRGAHGGVRAGILATGVDVVAAVLAVRSLAPDWLATTDLSLWTYGTPQRGPIACEARLLRSGRSNAVVEVSLYDEGADRAPVGVATAAFARIRRERAAEPADFFEERKVIEFATAGSHLDRPFVDKLGLTVGDAARGIVELPRTEYTINSFGSLQGGMVAMLVELAAEAAAGAAAGTPHAVLDLSIRYLEAGARGPYRTAATLLRRAGDQILARVEILDVGADKCMAVATANTRAAAMVAP